MKKIIIYPNEKLRIKSQRIKSVDESIRQLSLQMLEIMKKNKGIGLSAVQVGKPIQLITIGYQEELTDEEYAKGKVPICIPEMVLVNPKITAKSKETNILEEGCLSLPGMEIPIKRANKINVLAQDVNGKKIKIRVNGLTARVLQHEIDHLSGVLIVDKAIKTKK